MIDLKNRKVLVTGGAGFVGSSIVNELVKRGAIVTILDNLSTGLIELVPKHKNISFIKGDVEDPEIINLLLQDHKLIIHAAAQNIIKSTADPLSDFNTNIGGTLNILIHAKKLGIEKMIYTGSASVYGNSDIIPTPESSATYTLSPYAVSKLCGENYCISFYETYDVPVGIVRYSNVYGPGQSTNNPYCGVISKFLKSAINSDNILIHGDGNQTRDFTYIDDAVNATIEALINNKSIGEIFNIGTGFEYSINNLSELIIKIIKNNNINSSSFINKIDKRDIDNVRRRAVNIEKIRRILKWSPNFTLNDGLIQTYNWLNNEK